MRDKRRLINVLHRGIACLCFLALLLTGVGFASSGAGTQSFAYVTNSDDDTVSVIDTATNAVVATVEVGTGPRGVAFTPEGSRAYVTNYYSHTVSVIDTDTN